LASRGLLEIMGPAAREFLQGQTTCDFAQLNQTTTLTGAYCTPQGRMVCDFRASEYQPDQFLLQTDLGVCAQALATFGKYIVFSRAELRNTSSDWRQYGFWGDDVAQLLSAPVDAPAWQRDGISWFKNADNNAYLEACVPAAAAAAFESQLELHFERKPESAWQRWEIDAGIGHVQAQTSGLFLPQMLNYQLTGRINFNKGCYTGQEVVARLHYRGKTKRPMYLARLQPPLPGTLAGDALYRAEGDQGIGTVVNAVSDDRETRILAAIASSAADGEVFLGSPGGARLELLDLPYSLPD
jgi:folate-binding protein YgfZ